MIQTTPLIQTVAPAADFSLARQLFGDNFDVWVRDADWQRVTAAGSTGGPNSEMASQGTVAQHLRRMSELSGLQFVDLNAQESLCLLAVPDDHLQIVTVSVVNRSPETMLELTQRAASAAILQQRRGYQIHLRLEVAADCVRVSIESYCLASQVANIKPRDLHDHRPGGLGTHFVSQIADRIEYVPSPRHPGSVTLVIEKSLTATPRSSTP